jgi:hypothetical protein
MPIGPVAGFEWDDVNINHLGERGVADREYDGIWRPITARDAEPEEREQFERRVRR